MAILALHLPHVEMKALNEQFWAFAGVPREALLAHSGVWGMRSYCVEETFHYRSLSGVRCCYVAHKENNTLREEWVRMEAIGMGTYRCVWTAFDLQTGRCAGVFKLNRITKQARQKESNTQELETAASLQRNYPRLEQLGMLLEGRPVHLIETTLCFESFSGRVSGCFESFFAACFDLFRVFFQIVFLFVSSIFSGRVSSSSIFRTAFRLVSICFESFSTPCFDLLGVFVRSVFPVVSSCT